MFDKQALDRWLTTEPDWRSGVNDDELNDWGMDFINAVDAKVQEPQNALVLEAWKEGDFHACKEWMTTTYPELTEEQLDWVEEFLSEI